MLEAFRGIESAEAEAGVPGSGPGRPALPLSRYSLFVAEDDGSRADPDLPEVRGGRWNLRPFHTPPPAPPPLIDVCASQSHKQVFPQPQYAHASCPARTPHAPPFYFLCQIDHRVPITSVGVDKFVLVQRGSTEAGASEGGAASGVPEGDIILLRLTIPQSSIAFRACEAGTAPQLTLTCYPHKEAGVSNSFTVQLTGGGSAKPAEGVAAPSLQAQTDVFAATLAAPPE